MRVFCYYPLKDRLVADLYRDLLLKTFPDAQIGPMTDFLTDDHPLPQFGIEVSEKDREAIHPHLVKLGQTLSVRIIGAPDSWLGRKRDTRDADNRFNPGPKES